MIIAVRDDGSLLFENQFRYPLQRDFLELPAGKIDPGEAIRATGGANCWRNRLRGCPVASPGRDASLHRLFRRAHRDFPGERSGEGSGPSLDHNEFLDVLTLTLDQAVDAVREGRVTDAKTITALFWADRILAGNW